MEQIKCPRCGKRLFNVSADTRGTFTTICTRCKAVVVIDHKAPELTQTAPAERQ